MRYVFLIIALSLVSPAWAQTAISPNPEKDQPIEITATRTIEWHRNDQKYIARGDAIAVQGDVSVHGEILSADYRGGQNTSTEIYRLTAQGNVKVQNEANTAYGDQAIYDVDRGLATMTGSNLRLTSPGQIITADKRFEYWAAQGRANAIGNAIVARGEDRLQSDKISAFFKEDQNGQQVLDRLEANGRVVITTPTEVLTGDRGVYKASTNIAEITGNVKITRGPNILEGSRAQVNLTTNVSKMFSSKSGDGRVRGIFYPESKNSN